METEAAILKALLEMGPAGVYLGIFMAVWLKIIKPQTEMVSRIYETALATANARIKELVEERDTTAKATLAMLARLEQRLEDEQRN